MLEALHVRDFRLLWLGRSVGSLGTWLLVVAVPAHVLHLTGSPTAAGLTLAAEFLPPVVLGPAAGAVVDRWDRRTVLVAADLLRASAVALLLVVRDADDMWLVYTALVLEGVGTVAFRPAVQAHVPTLTGTGPLLVAANTLTTATDGTIRLVGAPLGGVLLGVAGWELLVCVDVLSYLLSALAISRTTRSSAAEPNPRSLWRHELIAGLDFLRHNRTARALFLVNAIFLGANAALTALLVPHTTATLGGPTQTGLVLSGLGVGFLLGAPVTRRLHHRPRLLLGGALTGTAAGCALLFAATTVPTALAAAVVVGAFGSAVLTGMQTLLQRTTPNALLGRVGAALFTGEAVASFAGALAGAAAAGHTRDAVAGACALTLVAALVAVRVPDVRDPPTTTDPGTRDPATND